MSESKTTQLEIRLQGHRIGYLNRLPSEQYLLAFEDEYEEDPERPVLSQSFLEPIGKLRPPKVSGNRLYPYFSNLLPEGHLREYLSSRLKIKTTREFFLLEALGDDLPGAITVHPAGVDEMGTAPPPDGAEDNESPFKFSLAGVQLKFSAFREADGGLTLPVSGSHGDWIIKFPSEKYRSVPENEFAMMTLARRCGMNVPEGLSLIDTSSIGNLPTDLSSILPDQAFAISRFDREESDDGTQRRIHHEDFAQIFRVWPERKYDSGRNLADIARFINEHSHQPEQCLTELLSRIALSVAIGNGDMHLKNWSIIYPDGRSLELAPLYDMLCTTVYIEGDSQGLQLGKSKSLEGLRMDQISNFCRQSGLSAGFTVNTILTTLECIEVEWQKLEVRSELPDIVDSHIDCQIKKVIRNTRRNLSPLFDGDTESF